MKRSYSPKVMEALVEMLDIDPAESIDDIRHLYSQDEVFDAVAAYYGGIASGYEVRQLVEDIYTVDLSQIEESEG